MNSDLRKEMEKADLQVIKRLKFILKIIKAVSGQSNVRNRQAHGYFFQVLDCLNDWSGNWNAELSDVMEDEIFPQMCSLISTFNRDEFNIFQAFMFRYLMKCNDLEAVNYAVIDFIGDLYGFMTRIAPPNVVEEYLEIFSLETMPFFVSLVIMPAILRNLTGDASSKLSDRLRLLQTMCLLQNSKGEITENQRLLVKRLWTSFADSTKHLRDFRRAAPIINQCIVTSCYLQSFSNADLVSIVQDLLDWGSIVKGFHLDLFLIISGIFLTGARKALDVNSSSTFDTATKNLILLVAKNVNESSSKSIRILTMSILQHIFEHSKKEFKEVLEEFHLLFDLDKRESRKCSSDNIEEILTSLEKYANEVSCEPAIVDSAENRNRLKLIISDLNKVLI